MQLLYQNIAIGLEGGGGGGGLMPPLPQNKQTKKAMSDWWPGQRA